MAVGQPAPLQMQRLLSVHTQPNHPTGLRCRKKFPPKCGDCSVIIPALIIVSHQVCFCRGACAVDHRIVEVPSSTAHTIFARELGVQHHNHMRLDSPSWIDFVGTGSDEPVVVECCWQRAAQTPTCIKPNLGRACPGAATTASTAGNPTQSDQDPVVLNMRRATQCGRQ